MSLIGLLLKFVGSFAACHKETPEKYIGTVYSNCNDTILDYMVPGFELPAIPDSSIRRHFRYLSRLGLLR